MWEGGGRCGKGHRCFRVGDDNHSLQPRSAQGSHLARSSRTGWNAGIEVLKWHGQDPLLGSSWGAGATVHL
jgi:hypothetical protein